ncbi:hypothetical protein BCV71DRAFT_232176 [Rhizopus microsporus]|uniref:Uncharacterized protein n=1 Tax=Rhizopus microsporus TaxID=58291 RepID=A0A1X0SB94_RHIZD|nr:hypothetical protein BCV71DRAFT_232176 [Rhizopus microsporus]
MKIDLRVLYSMNTKQTDLTVGEFAKKAIPSKDDDEAKGNDDADGPCDEGKYNDDKDEVEEELQYIIASAFKKNFLGTIPYIDKSASSRRPVEEVDGLGDEAVNITENEGDY